MEGGVIFFILNMIIATQYAITKIMYEFTIFHQCDSSIIFIGSDNSTDGRRILRIAGSNTTNVKLKLDLGDGYSIILIITYYAVFRILNDESYSLNITHINGSSANATYMKIGFMGI
jgi:hypothetical protein